MSLSSTTLLRVTRFPRSLQTRQSRYVTTRNTNSVGTTSTTNTTTTTTTTTHPPPPLLRLRPFQHDSLPRYPTTTPQGLLRLSDYIGTTSFAYSGTLLAAASGMDILGSTIVGTITAVGGGTIRDAIILNKSPFWVEETEYLYICLITGITTFSAYSNSKPGLDRQESIPEFTTDTLGVGAFCVIGAMNAVRANLPGLVCGVCGMATATFGGVVRDVLCKRDVRILHSRAEIYATAAAAGAAGYLVASRFGAGAATRLGCGVGLACVLRVWASSNDVRLPVWSSSSRDGQDGCEEGSLE